MTFSTTRIGSTRFKLLISGAICIGLFLFSSLGLLVLSQMLNFIPERYAVPSLCLYLLGLVVTGFYSWRWITRQFNRNQPSDQKTVA